MLLKDEKIAEYNTSSKNIASRIVREVFDLASRTPQSKLYASLVKDLMESATTPEIKKNEWFAAIRNEMTTYQSSFEHIRFVEPNVDEDEFCKCNKENASRKHLSSFAIHLLEIKLIHKIKAMQFLSKICRMIETAIHQENMNYTVSELVENLKILSSNPTITPFGEIIEEDEGGEFPNESFLTKVERMKSYKPSSTKSLSMKSSFLFRDILDLVENNE